MLRSTIGAHRASPHHPVRLAIGFALVAATIGALALAPVAGASSRTVITKTSGTVIGLTTTTVNKPFFSVEQFYLGLVNCTRTGGWVLSDGTCRGYGSGRYSAYVAPIRYSIGLSDMVSRPYAYLLSSRNLCSHTAYGDPGYRLRRAGYTNWMWGENIGCRDGYSTAKAAVLASHLKFQAEKPTNGGHWKNIKNAKYHAIGIGIWRHGTRTRLVTDFYG